MTLKSPATQRLSDSATQRLSDSARDSSMEMSRGGAGARREDIGFKTGHLYTRSILNPLKTFAIQWYCTRIIREVHLLPGRYLLSSRQIQNSGGIRAEIWIDVDRFGVVCGEQEVYVRPI